MNRKHVELLRQNAPSIFTEYAVKKLASLKDEIDMLRFKYKDASIEERPFIESAGKELKEDLEYFEHALKIITFS